MIGALRELDAEGCFDTGAARERVTLLVSISDSERSAEVEAASRRALNPGRGARMRP